MSLYLKGVSITIKKGWKKIILIKNTKLVQLCVKQLCERIHISCVHNTFFGKYKLQQNSKIISYQLCQLG